MHNQNKCSSIVVAVMLLFTVQACKKEAQTNSQTVVHNEIVFNTKLSYGSVKDIDGNSYKTIVIGTQTWTAENLKVKKYSNGDAIANLLDTAWNTTRTGAYCDIFDKPLSVDSIYGRLYNGYAVLDARNLCPSGWHVPSDSDFTILSLYLGGASVAGNKLQEIGKNHWNMSSSKVKNETGFTALPAGSRGPSKGAEFANQTAAASWWTSTPLQNATGEINYWQLANAEDSINQFTSDVYMSDGKHGDSKVMGLSVRCIKN